jgi:ADP-heptose:LPS heptosyltransferase
MHLGHAVGVNSVCLYSMSPVHRTRALDEAYVHKVVQRRPAKGVVLSPAECMSLIPMEDVYEACRQVLNALS